MLDVGFSEILLTSAIALIVLGPERLPKVARQVGNWMGRARAMARQLTEQLEREVNADELMKVSKPNSTLKPKPPAPYDLAATPPPTPAQPATPPAQVESTAYSSAPAAAPHGADWHPAPPDSKTGNG
jgi:sec-independent protein translocase protein TatB